MLRSSVSVKQSLYTARESKKAWWLWCNLVNIRDCGGAMRHSNPVIPGSNPGSHPLFQLFCRFVGFVKPHLSAFSEVLAKSSWESRSPPSLFTFAFLNS